PTPLEEWLGTHPETRAFLAAPKPSPASFAQERYFGVTALEFVGSGGARTAFRYRVEPVEGVRTLGGEELKGRPADYLFKEVEERVVGGRAVEFRVLAQLAGEGDVVDDATVHWPESREVVELGVVRADALVREEEQAAQQKRIIFDPIPRVEGIEPSADPLLDVRASVYLISGRERRAA
ncbi:heme-dependent catalase, partial [Glonium stellatum]